MTMTPHEVISMLNRHHNEVVFPLLFDDVRFDMVSEIEYHFAIVDAPKRKGTTSKRVVITHSEFWMTPDRDPEGHFFIAFDKTEGKRMGRWLHNIIDPTSTSKTGRIGYSNNVQIMDKVAAPGTIVVASERGVRESGGRVTPA